MQLLKLQSSTPVFVILYPQVRQSDSQGTGGLCHDIMQAGCIKTKRQELANGRDALGL